jgi:ribosomal protein S18 acetylase RimI-like enzyme
MPVEELQAADARAAAALWHTVGLTTPWNDPVADFERAMNGSTSTVLGLREDGAIVGTAMIGHDGHRGWVYYLAVDPGQQGRGLGAELMQAAEEWLAAAGAVKVQLMVRETNQAVIGFYEHLGYGDSEVRVLSRWMPGGRADDV